MNNNKRIKIGIKRGDVFIADLGISNDFELKGIRPVVVVQNDVANKYASTIVVVPVTTGIVNRSLPTHVEIHMSEGFLKRESLIVVEQIRVIDKVKLRNKIGQINDATFKAIENAIGITTGIKTNYNDLQKLEKVLLEMTKPLIITEGKTDAKLIEIGWKKLYPCREMYFECRASGIEIDEDKRIGNADSVRRSIEYLASISDRDIIGLFDNDREGNEQFRGLNKKSFEKYDISKNYRKHKARNIWGLLLPVPDERKLFVTEDDITQRYFVIEHYFADDVLKNHSMYGNNILGTSVFRVKNRKEQFSNEANLLEREHFKNFRILFDEIETILR